jgi:signal transduction histidine kinase
MHDESAIQGEDSQTPRVMIVDDDRDTVLELADLLSSSEIICSGYTNAAQALESLSLRADRPPLGAFVDLMMPGMNGIEFIRRIRAMPAPAGAMPIVVFTGADDDRLDAVAQRLDILRVLHKPSSHAELTEALDAMRRAGCGSVELAGGAAPPAGVRPATDNENDLKLQLALALKLRDDFIDLVNHEMRNPLNGVLGAADLLRMRADHATPDQIREMTDIILAAGRQLLHHFEAVMELSGEDKGTTQQPIGPTSVEAIVQGAVAKVRVPEGAEISAPTAMGPNSPMILGRAKRLEAAVAAVVDNALRFSNHPPRVNVTIRHGNDASTIMVSDNGIGMSLEESAAAFDVFRQIDSSRSRRNYGLGVGLPLARKYLMEQGGTIELESAKGIGTTVTMTVPHRIPDQLVAPDRH